MVDRDDLRKIKKYFRASNYLSAIQIYLQSNFLLEKRLDFGDIKPRLLGHWGTCPGINFVYSHLQYLIKKTGVNLIFVNGPGHGYPALQANLFLEGSLSVFYPEASLDYSGISYLAKNFSWPYGFPSHSFPGTPGVILEGGELGYSLAVAYGAILDNPELIVACLIGDGEAETGTLSSSWFLNRFIDPRYNGAVLPILHLNGYKISGPTILGRMSLLDLNSYFWGLGYEPYFVELVEGEDIHARMVEVLFSAYNKIRFIQNEARSGRSGKTLHFWPVIILKTPKGWTGIKELDGKVVEGNYLSHQVVAKNASIDVIHLAALENWLRSYKFSEIFDREDGFDQDIFDIVPEDNLKMGLSKYVHFGDRSKLIVPDSSLFAEFGEKPGEAKSSSMRRLGEFLNAVMKANSASRNFRLFSPDETYSNKIDKVFESTKRAFVWPKDRNDEDMDNDGLVIEMLNENALFGLLQGYTLTGRAGIFVSYEAFVQIISSMVDQYLKFLKVSRTIKWRPEYHSVNIVLTSSGWRQDHNGFSHQNPGFLSSLIEKNDPFVKIYFPLDGNTTLAVIEYCLRNTSNGINVIVAGKTLEPVWLGINRAIHIVGNGMGILDFLSDDDPDPDIVFCGIGDYVTKELIAARKLIKQDFPNIKIRFVSVIEINSLRKCDVEYFFGTDIPVIFNFHGYPDTLKKILFDFGETSRFYISGYVENGSTTTPFDMQVRNKTSRWHVYLRAIKLLYERGRIDKDSYVTKHKFYKDKLSKHRKYIRIFGVDMDEVLNFDFSV